MLHISKFNLKFGLLFKEIVLVGLTLILGVLTGKRVYSEVNYQALNLPEIPLWQFLFIFLLGTALIFTLTKTQKGGTIIKLFFALAIFSGCYTIFSTFFPWPWPLLLSLLMIGLRFLVTLVITQDLAIILGVAGIAVILGLSLPLTTTIIILVLLSIYDVIAVLRTQHMTQMFKNLLSHGIFFALVIPEKISDLFTNLKKVTPGKNFVLLGTGDIAFPIIFASSVLNYGIYLSLAIIFGALIGNLVNHLLLMSRLQKVALPALPAIVLFSLLAFLGTWLVFYS